MPTKGTGLWLRMEERMSCRKRAALAWLALLLAPCCAAPQSRVVLVGAAVEAGTRADITLNVPEGNTDGATQLPVTVLRGARPGPTLLMVAGVHGYEFAPILAAAQLAEEVDPARLAGTLIVARVAHVSAFEHRTPYVNPFDRKNLNRSFPGTRRGTQTERLAWLLSTRVIPAADVVLDVHSGDGAEWLAPFAGVYGGPLATGYPTALKVAEAFGLPNLVRYSMDTQAQVDRGRSLNRQAVAQGLPTVLIEIGENGERDPDSVATLVAGVKNALVALGMTDEPPTAPSPVRCFDGTESVATRHSGLWSPRKAFGRPVARGEVLGVVRDYHGSQVETVRAPRDGYALYGLAGPPVRKGESVLTLAKPGRQAVGSAHCAEAQPNSSRPSP